MRKVRRTRKRAPPRLVLDDKRMVRSQDLREELIPGIPNEIALSQIVPKLPHWRDFYNLSSVSRSWLQAIQSHQVYNARVGSHSAETLAVVNHEINDDVSAIALYSVRDERLYDLPPIPHVGGIPSSSQCVSLDGKLYVLGGLKDSKTELASDQVHVLDLAGQIQWRKCASMRHRRKLFGCGIVNGKIYVCGGLSRFEPVCGAEVYDPEVDSWSPVPPMPSIRFDHRVEPFGDSIVVHGGMVFYPEYMDWKHDRIVDHNGTVTGRDGDMRGLLWDFYSEDETSSEHYQPVKKEWQSFRSTTPKRLMFTERGIYSLSWRDIYINNGNGQDEWTHLHSLSSESSVASHYGESVGPFVTVVVDDELLAIVHWENSFRDQKSALVRSKGFCSEQKEIVWKNAPWHGSGKHSSISLSHIMCTVML